MHGYQQYKSSENIPPFERQFERSFEQRYQREQTILEITNGYVVAIDQFMLANQQLVSALPKVIQDISEQSISQADIETNIDKVREAVCSFGGSCFEVENGKFYVTRDTYQKAIVVSQAEELSSLQSPGDAEGAEPKQVFSIDDIALKGEELFSVGQVFIDTRCVVLCDVKILFNSSLLEEYAKLREQDKDKPARDLLRDNGCAVRYGFMPYGDELTVYVTRDKKAAAFF